MGKPDGKGAFVRYRRRWKDYFKTGWFICFQIETSGGPLVNTEMSLRVPYNSGNFLFRWATISFSKSVH
jgi:hypothetical protein